MKWTCDEGNEKEEQKWKNMTKLKWLENMLINFIQMHLINTVIKGHLRAMGHLIEKEKENGKLS